MRVDSNPPGLSTICGHLSSLWIHMCYKYLPLEISKDVGMYIQLHLSQDMSKKQHIQEKIIGIQDTRKLKIKSEVDVLQVLFLQLS